MKKIIAIILCFCCISFPAKNCFAFSERAEITITNCMNNIADYKKSKINIEIFSDYNKSTKYIIKYTVDAWQNTMYEELNFTAGKRLNHKIPVSNLKKGPCNLEIMIINDDNLKIICEKSFEICIAELYEKQFLDELSKNSVQYYTAGDKYPDIFWKIIEGSGVKNIRGTSLRWHQAEQLKGKYNFSVIDRLIPKAKEKGINSLAILFGGNSLYTGDASYIEAADNKEEMEAFWNMIDAFYDKYPYINNALIWNEPTGPTFWKDPNPVDYANLHNYVSYKLLTERENLNIVGASLSTGPTAAAYLEDMFDMEFDWYADTFSFHPYIGYYTPNTIEAQFEPKIYTYIDVSKKHGGWIEPAVTEFGYETGGASAISEEMQAKNLVKFYVAGDEHGLVIKNWYNFIDEAYGTPGLVTTDYNAKKGCYAALCKVNSMLNNAVYVGKLTVSDGVDLYMYNKLGKPIGVLWNKKNENFVYKPTDGISVFDIYGNAMDTGEITLDNSVYYLESVPEHYLLDASRQAVLEKFEDLQERYENIYDLSGVVDVAEKYKSASALNAKLSCINSVFENAKTFINSAENPSDESFQFMIYSLYKIASSMADCMTVDNPVCGVNASDEFKKVVNTVETETGDGLYQAKRYTGRMLRYAYRRLEENNKFKKLENCAERNAIIETNEIIASKLIELADVMNKHEKTNDTFGLFHFPDSTAFEVFLGDTKEIKLQSVNLSDKLFEGKIYITNDKMQKISDEKTISLKKNEVAENSLTFKVDEKENLGNIKYYIVTEKNGEIVKKHLLNLEVKSAISAELKNMTSTLSEASELSVDIQNISDTKVRAELIVTPPDGWELEKSSERFVLQPKEKSTLKFGIKAAKKVPYNNFEVAININNSEGISMYSESIPLNFAVAVKSDEEIDINDKNAVAFADAYPVYGFRSKTASPDMDFQKKDCYLTAYSKWTENNYYMLIDVVDQAHVNSQTDGNEWNADSVQFGFDTLNDKAQVRSEDDDYEIVIAHMNDKNVFKYYFAPEFVDKSINYKDNIRCYRDSNNTITRYIVKIPREDLKKLVFRTGTKFGFTVGANDADTVAYRESYVEFTQGIISGGKNPSLFAEFVLKESDGYTEYDKNAYEFVDDWSR